ncbi:hypothetical protein ASE29_07915 [Ensifer sp. Root74]|nr:hypothetical protein ASD49_07020 [Ensifer sp. Root1298]KQX76656.1 hypothetical protein ASD41_07270 [Ensifer sp. Root1312]KRC17168.1 hypothetical protein ASE29_07915 [Ensifer sp. Root74]
MFLRGQFGTLFNRHYALVLFVVIFLIPTVCSLLFVAIASGRYVSEAQYIVRGVNSVQAGALSNLLRTFGLSRSNDDSYAIESYVLSRDALTGLNKRIDIASVYRRPEADILTRYKTYFGSDSIESLFDYYQNQIVIIRDFETGITTLTVSAYRAEDAKKILEELLALGEARVNEMNERSRNDLLRVAEQTVREAEKRVLESQLELTRFRFAELNVDLEQAAAGRVDIVMNLIKDLVKEEVSLSSLEESAPSSPAVVRQRRIVDALRDQVNVERSKIAGSDVNGLAAQLGAYEPLILKKAMAERAYEASVRALDQAREEARRKQIYLEPIVKPHLPDKATMPRRIHTVFTVALLTFASFVMIYLLVSGGKEHMNLH